MFCTLLWSWLCSVHCCDDGYVPYTAAMMAVPYTVVMMAMFCTLLWWWLCSVHCCDDDYVPYTAAIMTMFRTLLWWWLCSVHCCDDGYVPYTAAVMAMFRTLLRWWLCSAHCCDDDYVPYTAAMMTVPYTVVIMAMFRTLLWWWLHDSCISWEIRAKSVLTTKHFHWPGHFWYKKRQECPCFIFSDLFPNSFTCCWLICSGDTLLPELWNKARKLGLLCKRHQGHGLWNNASE